MNRSEPPGRSTRRSSATVAAGSGTVHSTIVLTTVSYARVGEGQGRRVRLHDDGRRARPSPQPPRHLGIGLGQDELGEASG